MYLSKTRKQTSQNGLYPFNPLSNGMKVSENEMMFFVHFWIVVSHKLLMGAATLALDSWQWHTDQYS
jgi:hypothetical protein